MDLLHNEVVAESHEIDRQLLVASNQLKGTGVSTNPRVFFLLVSGRFGLTARF
jgi:hypothetical protein